MTSFRGVVSGLLAIALLAGMVFFQRQIDRSQLAASKEGHSLTIFPKPDVVKMASLGHTNLIADYYWLKTIQYQGICLILKIPPKILDKYAQFVTDLDPKFMEAYYYPAVIMIVQQINPRGTIALLEKGRKNLPQEGRIAYLTGLTYYYLMDEREKAAKNLDEAAKLNNYAPYAILAARIRAEGNNPELSLAMLNEFANDPKLSTWKPSMVEMSKGLQQQSILKKLNNLLEQYQAEKNVFPDKLEQLVSAGLISSLPQDPVGGTFYIDPADHQAKSTKEYYTKPYRPKEWQK